MGRLLHLPKWKRISEGVDPFVKGKRSEIPEEWYPPGEAALPGRWAHPGCLVPV